MKTSQLLYNEHLAFSNLAEPLPISQELLDQFNACYTLLAIKGNFLDPADRTKLSFQLQDLLKQIFEDLKLAVPSQDEKLKLFVIELHSQAERLLNRDLEEKLLLSHRSFSLNQTQESTTQWNLWVSQMLNERYFTGSISESVLQELQSVAEPMIELFRSRSVKGQLTREDLSVNTGDCVQQIAKIINTEFERLGINQAVGIYCSQPMRVQGLALELSVPTAQWWRNSYKCYENNLKTHYLHTDEGLGIPKAIVYLSDVSKENGPFSVIPSALEFCSPSPIQLLLGRIIGCVGRNHESPLFDYYQHKYHKTFDSSLFRKHFMNLPPEMRYNSHFGWDIIPRSSLEEELISKEIILDGKAGFYGVFDGASLVHRGGLVQTGERIALQVIFRPVPVAKPKTKPTLKRRIIAKIKSNVKKIIPKKVN